ncbi:hypothetical protein HanHA89_Chr12g0457931 [Helianthus annuus]|nr:hypothetical protein HanHA89_Chr12g0457931 [Helianthus annuus]
MIVYLIDLSVGIQGFTLKLGLDMEAGLVLELFASYLNSWQAPYVYGQYPGMIIGVDRVVMVMVDSMDGSRQEVQVSSRWMSRQMRSDGDRLKQHIYPFMIILLYAVLVVRMGCISKTLCFYFSFELRMLVRWTFGSSLFGMVCLF